MSDPSLRSGRGEYGEPALEQVAEGQDEMLEEQEYHDPKVQGLEVADDSAAGEEDHSVAWVAGLGVRADAVVDTGPYYR